MKEEGDKIVSLAINPKRIEDEVLDRLRYTNGKNIDTFTLNRFYMKLKNVIENSTPEPKTFLALGVVLFEMGRFSQFIEEYEKGRRLFPTNLDLYKGYTLGLFNIVEKRYFSVPKFDLFSFWFNKKMNIYDEPFRFNYGSKAISYGGNIFNLERENVALITLYADKKVKFEFSPFTFYGEYNDLLNIDLNFDEYFSWEVTEKILNNELSSDEKLYLKEILGGGYGKFLSLANPDYSELLNIENVGDETYNSVEDFMESIAI